MLVKVTWLRATQAHSCGSIRDPVAAGVERHSMALCHSSSVGCMWRLNGVLTAGVAGIVQFVRWQAPTYLALIICAVRRRLQRALQSTLVIASSQQLPYLLGGVLDIGGRYGLDSRCERAKVEVGGAVGVQRVNVDGPPVDVGHGDECVASLIGIRGGSRVGAAGCRGAVVCRRA